jgi:hypothetical protein
MLLVEKRAEADGEDGRHLAGKPGDHVLVLLQASEFDGWHVAAAFHDGEGAGQPANRQRSREPLPRPAGGNLIDEREHVPRHYRETRGGMTRSAAQSSADSRM